MELQKFYLAMATGNLLFMAILWFILSTKVIGSWFKTITYESIYKWLAVTILMNLVYSYLIPLQYALTPAQIVLNVLAVVSFVLAYYITPKNK